jgi:GNAT superfamily N-acetyltransferase
MQPWALEALGYLASVLVAISLTMSSIVRLRLINLAGSLAFAVYGYLIGSHPVAAVNLFIAVVNVVYLRRMLANREGFRILETSPDSEYLGYFLDHYRDEIRRFFPSFPARAPASSIGLFVLRDMVPAGVLLGDQREDTLDVQLDFVIPQFRDFKVGRFLFDECAEFFRSRGIREIRSAGGTAAHAAYLRRIGFEPVGAAGDAASEYRLRVG